MTVGLLRRGSDPRPPPPQLRGALCYQVDHWKLSLVCKRWQCLLTGKYLYSLRRSLGIMEEWIYVIRVWTSTSPSPLRLLLLPDCYPFHKQ
ncbi:hypothetical protein BHE74_00020733 [Ensete ventricosum]|nr:hypothetical protein BHE74_00020733 [Ensete ventricosum]